MCFWKRIRGEAVDTLRIQRESRESLERATAELERQEKSLASEKSGVGRRYDKIIEDNNLAEVVRRAFSGESI